MALDTALTIPISTCEYYEETKGRRVYRCIELYENKAELPKGWNGIERLIKVRRWGDRKQVPFEETSFYATSQFINSAATAAKAIQEHWAIENKLHWVKDVNLKEDKMTVKHKNAVQIFVYFNNIVVNILNKNGYKPVKSVFAKIKNKVNKLAELFTII